MKRLVFFIPFFTCGQLIFAQQAATNTLSFNTLEVTTSRLQPTDDYRILELRFILLSSQQEREMIKVEGVEYRFFENSDEAVSYFTTHELKNSTSNVVYYVRSENKQPPEFFTFKSN